MSEEKIQCAIFLVTHQEPTSREHSEDSEDDRCVGEEVGVDEARGGEQVGSTDQGLYLRRVGALELLELGAHPDDVVEEADHVAGIQAQADSPAEDLPA